MASILKILKFLLVVILMLVVTWIYISSVTWTGKQGSAFGKPPRHHHSWDAASNTLHDATNGVMRHNALEPKSARQLKRRHPVSREKNSPNIRLDTWMNSELRSEAASSSAEEDHQDVQPVGRKLQGINQTNNQVRVEEESLNALSSNLPSVSGSTTKRPTSPKPTAKTTAKPKPSDSAMTIILVVLSVVFVICVVCCVLSIDRHAIRQNYRRWRDRPAGTRGIFNPCDSGSDSSEDEVSDEDDKKDKDNEDSHGDQTNYDLSAVHGETGHTSHSAAQGQAGTGAATTVNPPPSTQRTQAATGNTQSRGLAILESAIMVHRAAEWSDTSTPGSPVQAAGHSDGATDQQPTNPVDATELAHPTHEAASILIQPPATVQWSRTRKQPGLVPPKTIQSKVDRLSLSGIPSATDSPRNADGSREHVTVEQPDEHKQTSEPSPQTNRGEPTSEQHPEPSQGEPSPQPSHVDLTSSEPSPQTNQGEPTSSELHPQLSHVEPTSSEPSSQPSQAERTSSEPSDEVLKHRPEDASCEGGELEKIENPSSPSHHSQASSEGSPLPSRS